MVMGRNWNLAGVFHRMKEIDEPKTNVEQSIASPLLTLANFQTPFFFRMKTYTLYVLRLTIWTDVNYILPPVSISVMSFF